MEGKRNMREERLMLEVDAVSLLSRVILYAAFGNEMSQSLWLCLVTQIIPLVREASLTSLEFGVLWANPIASSRAEDRLDHLEDMA